MPAPVTLESIAKLYRDRGGSLYGGEAVTQLEHALQCANLARENGSTAATVTASLLHDVGHFLHNLGEDIADRGVDDRHEYRALPYLKKLFGPDVTEPIRLHVDAKRYLCSVDETYWSSLSRTSKISLELQGGIFSEDEAIAFIEQPYAEEAVKLRRWDDLAKVADCKTPDLDAFMEIAACCQVYQPS